ncbi:SDR family NAD(P)-dependent oxidoreductase [Saccharomonospora iraqiensis]|uniref:SDR family NAD(P)-dependent oxidoreductase n=1 Tax=Saccharomonospora iraqiensis TaxID=52698 RepID=UPI00022E67BB|nr:SDR family NAD(P)-dependent oxidoreductase [Saccharomonospora iraqiensis]
MSAEGASVPVAVITGAAGGIGTRLMRRFAAAGYEVMGLDLGTALPEGDDRYLACDITDQARVEATFATIMSRTGRIDVLVNNAGISAIGAFEDHGVDIHRRVLEVNYLGAVACTQAALPALRATRGRVVTLSSVAGFAPVLGRPAYVGAKHAVTGLFGALRPELAADGVGVTLVHPTFVTHGLREAAARADGTERSTTGAQVTPDDVARAVLRAVRLDRDRVLIGRIAWLSWHVRRLAPAGYVRLMTRRLRK